MLKIPIDHATFIAHHFEQKPVLWRQAVDVGEVEWRDLDDLLQTMEPDPAVMQLFLQGQVEPARYLREGIRMGQHRHQIDKFRFYDLMHQGATLVLNRIEDYFSAAASLCASIGRFTRQPAGSNSYISFGGDGTFGKHWDTHDVFAAQWIGKKLWRIYEPTLPLPLSHQTSRRTQTACPAQPSFEYVLEAGDILYIPRGWWHEVIPLDCASWHLSVGTYPQSIADYLLWLCNRELPQLRNARSAFVDGAALPAMLDEVMHALSRAAFNKDSQKEFLQSAGPRESIHTNFHSELFLVDPNASMPPDTVVSLSRHNLPETSTGDIQTHNGRLRLSPASRALIQFLHRKGDSSVRLLQEKFAEIPSSVLRATLLDLTRHEILCLQLPRV